MELSSHFCRGFMFIYCDIFPDIQIMRVLSLGTDYRNDQIADCQDGPCYAGANIQLQPCCEPISSVRTSDRSREWRHCSSLLAAPSWEANTPPLLHDSKVIHYDTKTEVTASIQRDHIRALKGNVNIHWNTHLLHDMNCFILLILQEKVNLHYHILTNSCSH